MQQFFKEKTQEQIGTALLAFLVLLVIFFLVKTWAEVRYARSTSTNPYPGLTISVEGEGKTYAIPDTAEFSFSVREQGATVAEAQKKVTDKMNAVLEAVKEAGVEEESIKTTNYAIYPRYEYRQAAQGGMFVPGREVLVGYEVTHTNQVKVKDTNKAGELLTTVGSLGATDVSGLGFTVEDESAVKDEARALAIEDAERKAKVLAKELDVKIVRVTSFYENMPHGYPQPMYDMAGMERSAVAFESDGAQSANVSLGQNEVVSNVTVTYEIK